ncbi:MAG: DUF4202 domain-containing protein [Cytophagales bacterium]
MNFTKACTAFEIYNQQDPNIFIWDGKEYAQEYFLAEQLDKWVRVLAPNASEALLLAAKCQHIGRWECPRADFPEGKVGYLNWRKNAALHHCKIAREILENCGYDAPLIERVEQILQKQKIKADAEVQTMENALCLVFLEFQYEDFQKNYDTDKVVHIVKKTLLKMDTDGHEQALQLPYSTQGLERIKMALNQL